MTTDTENPESSESPRRLTDAHMQNIIKEIQYHVFPGTTITTCCITTTANFSVVGYSSCMRAEDFIQETGEKAAYHNTIRKLYGLENYKQLHNIE